MPLTIPEQRELEQLEQEFGEPVGLTPDEETELAGLEVEFAPETDPFFGVTPTKQTFQDVIPQRPPVTINPPELADRARAQFFDAVVLDTVEALRPSSIYAKYSRINSQWQKEKRSIAEETGRDWENRSLSDMPRYIWGYLKASYGNESKAKQAIAHAKLIEKRGSFAIEMPPPKGAGEKAVDVAAGLSALITKLLVLKKVGTGTGVIPKGSVTGDMAVWEALGLIEQDIPGKGAATRGALGLIGKLPTGTITGKTAKVIAESGLFAGITAATGGSKEDIIISALLPVAFNGWQFAKQRKYLVNYEKSLHSAAQLSHQKRIKQGMSRATSEAYLKADVRAINNSVSLAKQKIYQDDAFVFMS